MKIIEKAILALVFATQVVALEGSGALEEAEGRLLLERAFKGGERAEALNTYKDQADSSPMVKMGDINSYI